MSFGPWVLMYVHYGLGKHVLRRYSPFFSANKISLAGLLVASWLRFQCLSEASQWGDAKLYLIFFIQQEEFFEISMCHSNWSYFAMSFRPWVLMYKCTLWSRQARLQTVFPIFSANKIGLACLLVAAWLGFQHISEASRRGDAILYLIFSTQQEEFFLSRNRSEMNPSSLLRLKWFWLHLTFLSFQCLGFLSPCLVSNFGAPCE